MITAAADGSSLSNPGPAGWAWFINDDCWAAGGWPRGTNNMGELMAVLDLLRSTSVDADEPLTILCDSQYVINSVTKWMPGWKRKGWRKKDGKPVLNVELLQAIDHEITGRQVSFEWVKGHAGHAMNEAADQRARAAATAFQQHAQPDTGPGYRSRNGQAQQTHGHQASPSRTDSSTTRQPSSSGSHRSVIGAPTPTVEPRSRHDDQPDLFGSGPARHDADLDAITEAERSLLSDQVRSDPAKLRALLHPDFVEYSASGRIWTRSRLLAQIQPLERATTMEVLGQTRISPDAILLRWRASAGDSTSLRSSLWVRENESGDQSAAQPRWRLLFAQGTDSSSRHSL